MFLPLIYTSWGEKIMVKVSDAAITALKSELQDLISEGVKPLVRLNMGIG
ncbi:MAG TPA: hypothetical protein VEV44_10000 [Pseudoneobacillus sp.]|nr:hypothetical protein [Pseudoneobacillus sp.]